MLLAGNFWVAKHKERTANRFPSGVSGQPELLGGVRRWYREGRGK